MCGTEVQIVDDVHQLLPPGSAGRLRYRSPGCAGGFYRDDAASNDAFHHSWFYPGDLARLDALLRNASGKVIKAALAGRVISLGHPPKRRMDRG